MLCLLVDRIWFTHDNVETGLYGSTGDGVGGCVEGSAKAVDVGPTKQPVDGAFAAKCKDEEELGSVQQGVWCVVNDYRRERACRGVPG